MGRYMTCQWEKLIADIKLERINNNYIDKLCSEAVAEKQQIWAGAVSVFILYTTHHPPYLFLCFSAPCGQIWACEDIFW